MERLTVLYDSGCGLCVRAREWLSRQAALLPLEFVPAASAQARRRFPGLEHKDPPEELVVVDDEGGVYRNDEAWIMTLYALEEYRGWSLRLASPGLRPVARAAFEWLSRHRGGLSRLLSLSDDAIDARVRPYRASSCARPGAAPGSCAPPAPRADGR
ncbi:MAG TPA: DUF393 domain-containing protein [Vicinamibacteria bacterium]|nr:DUF393 domain-containing protein [Vicinamibacteria bacterium]